MNVSVKLLLKLKVEQAMWEIGMDFEKEDIGASVWLLQILVGLNDASTQSSHFQGHISFSHSHQLTQMIHTKKNHIKMIHT